MADEGTRRRREEKDMFARQGADMRRRLLAFGVTEMDVALLSGRQREFAAATTLGILALERNLQDWPEILRSVAQPDFFPSMTAHWLVLAGGGFDDEYLSSAETLADRLIASGMPAHGVPVVNALIAAETSRAVTCDPDAPVMAASLQAAVAGALRRVAWLDSALIQDIYWRRGQDIHQRTVDLDALAARLADLAGLLASRSRDLAISIEEAGVLQRA